MSAVREVQGGIADRLRAVLPASAVIVEREALKPYECDGLSAYRATPLVAAIPASEEEVAAVLAVARETSTPVVARGSGTGLSGGALPHPDPPGARHRDRRAACSRGGARWG